MKLPSGHDLGRLEFEVEVLGFGLDRDFPCLLLLQLLCLHYETRAAALNSGWIYFTSRYQL